MKGRICSLLFNHAKSDQPCAGFAGGCHDKVANLIMAAPSVGWVDLSIINGEIVVKDGELKTLDLQVNTGSLSHFVFLHG